MAPSMLVLWLAACSSQDAAGDAGCRNRFYADADGDGQGDPDASVVACNAPTGHVVSAADCDDADAGSFLGAEEVCDLKDNDCDARIDEGLPGTFYGDIDGDGFGSAELVFEGCDGPPGYVANPDDCDDTLATVAPGQPETCNGIDDDCDGDRDEEPVDGLLYYVDDDMDGVGGEESAILCALIDGWASGSGDCDDADDAVHPYADEVCNGVDDDCDAFVDDQDVLTDVAAVWYLDADLDGYGGPVTTAACVVPPGYREAWRDCDDGDASVHPTAHEVCDGVDNDCDLAVDGDDTLAAGEGVDLWVDGDFDGFGGGVTVPGCEATYGTSEQGGDCNDADEHVWPGAPESCGAVDFDCDGLLNNDETDVDPASQTEFYVDADGDGLGDPDLVAMACVLGDGLSINGEDCDDGDDAVGMETLWWDDGDGDGFGFGATLLSCDAPSADAIPVGPEDCADGDASRHPAAVDLCDDAVDQNCNGVDADCYDPVGPDLDLEVAHAFLRGSSPGDDAGIAMDAPGDLDGDGFGDLLIGITADDDAGTQSGVAAIVRGPITGDTDLVLADVRVAGEGPDDKLGKDITGVGDFDGDGVADWAVAGRYHEVVFGGIERGTVYVLPGDLASDGSVASLSTAQFRGIGDGDRTGEELAAGDFDGDGLPDLAIGSEYAEVGGITDVGRVSIALGGLVGDNDVADLWVIEGTGPNANFADGLASAGDVDGDGTEDLLAGAYRADPTGDASGQAWLMFGPVVGDMTVDDLPVTFLGLGVGAKMGSDVAAGGDMNGDGVPDLLIGSRFEEGPLGASQGSVRFFAGGAFASIQLATDADGVVTGEAAADRLPQSLDVAGDVDGDGLDDALMGTDHNTTHGVDAGSAYLVLGPLLGETSVADAALRLRGMLDADLAGYEVAGGSDVDGDGRPDIVVSAYGANGSAGVVYIVFGGAL